MAESVELEPVRCELVGVAKADIAGIGILVGFSAQAFISLSLSIYVFFLSRLGRLEMTHAEGTADHKAEKKRLELVSDMLMVGNDIQMLTGISLIITCFTASRTIDLYHLHLVYDVASFVGVSNCAALVCWFFVKAKLDPAIAQRRKGRNPLHGSSHFSPRHGVTYLFAMLFLVLTVILEVRLNDWSLTSNEPGKCYITTGITSWTASHPGADKAYVGITAVWLLVVMLMTVHGSPGIRRPLLLIGALQFPVHFFMMIAIKIANQGHLEGEENENDWDFGQTTALMLLGVTLSELFSKWLSYRKFEKLVLGEAAARDELGDAEENGRSDELSEAGAHGPKAHSQTSRVRSIGNDRQDGIEMATTSNNTS